MPAVRRPRAPPPHGAGNLEHQLEGLRKEIARLVPGDIKSSLAPGLDALRIKIEELRGRRDVEMTGLALNAPPERTAVESRDTQKPRRDGAIGGGR